MENLIFVVNKEPYCLWEVDMEQRTQEFLQGIDTGYFEYLLQVHGEAEDEQRAAVALRTALHHATETFFTLIGAYVQATRCPHAWVAKCSNIELRKLIEAIDQGAGSIFNQFNLESVTWQAIATLMFRHYEPEEERPRLTHQFALLWSRLTNEYLDDTSIDEYNSIKHGFRIRPGGFSLSVGIEEEYAVPPSTDKTSLVGQSQYGCSFFRIKPINAVKKNRSLCSKRVSVNWSMARTLPLLQLITMSIVNVTNALKFENGIQREQLKYVTPASNSDFDKPWTHSTGVTNCQMDYVLDSERIRDTTREELLDRISLHKKTKGDTLKD